MRREPLCSEFELLRKVGAMLSLKSSARALKLIAKLTGAIRAETCSSPHLIAPSLLVRRV